MPNGYVMFTEDNQDRLQHDFHGLNPRSNCQASPHRMFSMRTGAPRRCLSAVTRTITLRRR
jgi:hypothetical protein